MQLASHVFFVLRGLPAAAEPLTEKPDWFIAGDGPA
jgi:hypothetical protein